MATILLMKLKYLIIDILKLFSPYFPKLILCEFHLMEFTTNPIHFPVLPYLTSTSSKRKGKTENYLPGSVSQCVPQNTLLSKQLCFPMFIAMSHCSALMPLASATLSILELLLDFFQISCCCSESWWSYSFGTAGQAPSHAPVHRLGKCWGRLTHSPISGSGQQLSWSACNLTPGPAVQTKEIHMAFGGNMGSNHHHRSLLQKCHIQPGSKYHPGLRLESRPHTSNCSSLPFIFIGSKSLCFSFCPISPPHTCSLQQHLPWSVQVQIAT